MTLILKKDFFIPPPSPQQISGNQPGQQPIRQGALNKISFRDTLMRGQLVPSPFLIDDIDTLLNDDTYHLTVKADDGIPTMHITKEEHRCLCEPWKKALIVKLLGKNLGPLIMEEQLRRIWKPIGLMFMTDLGNFFYVIKLEDELDYEKVIFRGPWLISNHYLTIQC